MARLRGMGIEEIARDGIVEAQNRVAVYSATHPRPGREFERLELSAPIEGTRGGYTLNMLTLLPTPSTFELKPIIN